MRGHVALLAIVLLALAACSGSDGENDAAGTEQGDARAPAEVESGDGEIRADSEPETSVIVDLDDPTTVVRAFTEALEVGADQRASELLLEGGWVVSGGRTLRLPESRTALGFVSTIPCYAEILALDGNEDQVAATFLMHKRSDVRPCALDGQETLALFTVRDGKIFIWEDLGTPQDIILSWARALSTGNHPRAADFYAPDAHVALSGVDILLPARRDAIAFHDDVPCSVEVEKLAASGNEIEATIILADRDGRECGISGRSTSFFLLKNGRIKEWREIPEGG